MSQNITFSGNLNWRKTKDEAFSSSIKSHTVSFKGKDLLHISAAKMFKGDPLLHNPEELLLSSLMSCHLMSYMYLCQIHKIEIFRYEDEGLAYLQMNSDGSGKINKAILNPKVFISNDKQKELAYELHCKASALCFIANSCNFVIEYNPTIIII